MPAVCTRKTNLLVGLGFLLLLGLVALLASLDNLTASFDTETYRICTYYYEIGDLKPGAPVKLGGVQVGRVSSVALEEDFRIKVIVSLKIGKSLPVDSRLNIESTTVSGDTFLAITRGNSAQTIHPAGSGGSIPILKGDDYFSISDLGVLAHDLQSLASGVGDSFTPFFDKESRFNRELEEVRADAQGLKKEYAALMEIFGKDTSLSRNIGQVSENGLRLSAAGAVIKEHAAPFVDNLPRIEAGMDRVTANTTAVRTTIDGFAKDREAAKKNYAVLLAWQQKLILSQYSILGLLTSGGCDGLPQTVGLIQGSVTKVMDYSLIRKLSHYFKAKDLFENFEEKTMRTLQLNPDGFYAAWVSFEKQRKAELLLRYPTACPVPSAPANN